MGIDPMTHKPQRTTLSSAAADHKNASNLSHMAQWESARLEAEARLVRESKLNRLAHADEPADQTLSSSSLSLSFDQILKKMPTTFAPPRCPDILKAWQGFVISRSVEGNNIIDADDNRNSTFRTVIPGGDCSPSSLRLENIIRSDTKCDGSATLLKHTADKAEAAGASWLGFGTIFGERGDGDEAQLEEVLATRRLETVGGAVQWVEDENLIESSYDDHLYELNKSYWNDMLNLVNCGPSNFPVF